MLKLRQREHELKQSGYGELNRFLREARQELENLVSQLKTEGQVSKEDTRRVKEFIRQVEQREAQEKEQLEQEETEFASREEYEFAPGMEVITGPGRRRGTLIRQAKKGYWLVEVGAMKITLPESDLTPVDTRQPSTDKQVGYGYSAEVASSPAVFTLDVRGKRLDEALDEVNRQIDNALLANLYEFEIIHGKGEGVLQTGIRNLLHDSPRVEEYSFARPEHGGTGKTVVKLKR